MSARVRRTAEAKKNAEHVVRRASKEDTELALRMLSDEHKLFLFSVLFERYRGKIINLSYDLAPRAGITIKREPSILFSDLKCRGFVKLTSGGRYNMPTVRLSEHYDPDILKEQLKQQLKIEEPQPEDG